MRACEAARMKCLRPCEAEQARAGNLVMLVLYVTFSPESLTCWAEISQLWGWKLSIVGYPVPIEHGGDVSKIFNCDNQYIFSTCTLLAYYASRNDVCAGCARVFLYSQFENLTLGSSKNLVTNSAA